MNQFDQQWQKLTALARQAPSSDAQAPYGFATRLAATAMTAPAESAWAGFERYALRGLLAAATLCVAAIAFNLTAVIGGHDDDLDLDDTVSQVLDLS